MTQGIHGAATEKAMYHALMTGVSMFKKSGGSLGDLLFLTEEIYKDTEAAFRKLIQDLYK